MSRNAGNSIRASSDAADDTKDAGSRTNAARVSRGRGRTWQSSRRRTLAFKSWDMRSGPSQSFVAEWKTRRQRKGRAASASAVPTPSAMTSHSTRLWLSEGLRRCFQALTAFMRLRSVDCPSSDSRRFSWRGCPSPCLPDPVSRLRVPREVVASSSLGRFAQSLAATSPSLADQSLVKLTPPRPSGVVHLLGAYTRGNSCFSIDQWVLHIFHSFPLLLTLTLMYAAQIMGAIRTDLPQSTYIVAMWRMHAEHREHCDLCPQP